MANTVNFRTMDGKAYQMCYEFVVARFKEAQEDLRHKDASKTLKKKRDDIITSRRENNLLECDLNSVLNENSLVDIENQIRAEGFKHEMILKPLKSAMEDSYNVIPDGLFDAYKLKFEGKNSQFVDMVEVFLQTIGIDCPKKGVVRKTADRIALMMGARIATSKTIINDNVFVSTMKKTQFNKLFMSGFIDTMLKAGVKFDIPSSNEIPELETK